MTAATATVQTVALDDAYRLLQQGRLEQVCPDCARREAAGFHCSGCTRAMGPQEWRRTLITEAQRAARTKTAVVDTESARGQVVGA